MFIKLILVFCLKVPESTIRVWIGFFILNLLLLVILQQILPCQISITPPFREIWFLYFFKHLMQVQVIVVHVTCSFRLSFSGVGCWVNQLHGLCFFACISFLLIFSAFYHNVWTTSKEISRRSTSHQRYNVPARKNETFLPQKMAKFTSTQAMTWYTLLRSNISPTVWHVWRWFSFPKVG